MKHTARQQSWAAAASEPGPELARGLFALLSEPNADERAAGITTSPLDEPEAGPAVPAAGPGMVTRGTCQCCGWQDSEPGDIYCAGCRDYVNRGGDPGEVGRP